MIAWTNEFDPSSTYTTLFADKFERYLPFQLENRKENKGNVALLYPIDVFPNYPEDDQ